MKPCLHRSSIFLGALPVLRTLNTVTLRQETSGKAEAPATDKPDVLGVEGWRHTLSDQAP